MTDIERDRFRNSRVLITGCAGFLGFYFMQFFAVFAGELKIERIIGLDTFLFGKPQWLNNLADKFRDLIELRKFDISSDDINKLEDAKSCDMILHMASVASPTYYRKYPLKTIDANIWGLRTLLDYYCQCDIKGFLFFSSSEVYGDPEPDSIPTSEDYRGKVATMGPRACYDESKRFGETVCYTFAHQFDMPVRIVRPFNNYGPGMNLGDRRVPADFAKSVRENRDIVMYSDGTPTRTFCYVSDAITGYLKTLVYEKFDCFNIGIDQPEITIKELALLYQKKGAGIMNYKGQVRFEKAQDREYLTHNPNRRCPVIKKAQGLLGYSPSVYVSEGVGRFLEFVRLTDGKL